jgi:hypothetical protein
MADNLTVTPGSGATVATNNINNIHYQRFKLTLGAGDAADMDTDSGQQAMASSLPVVIASDQSAVKTLDAGPAQTLVRTYTPSADMTTAAEITASPTGGMKIVVTDIIISSDTAMDFSIQMESSNNILAKVYLAAGSTVQITPRGYLKGDAADKKIYGKASVSGNVAITAIYFSET